ncbi:MAG: hypothetical protein SCK70_16345 [bacterium]|nr:hypothetical protein [bacterium]
MPFCPDCGYEYLPEFDHCPDCDVDLIEALPEEPDWYQENWVALRDLPGSIYAEMVKEVLDKQNIPNFIQSDATSATLLTRVVSSAGASSIIYVPKKHYQKCRQILLDMMDHI